MQWKIIEYLLNFSKDIKFGVKFKPRPHSGWSDKMNDIPAIWVLDVEPKSENDSPVTGYAATSYNHSTIYQLFIQICHSLLD